ncbi:hypothetical protein BD410DRAFT_842225 [Rickenella mellea]|uniref:Uncharacterized protein n=1 Tax=Rickenella mellea TaxID=50990 RepID=A0A4Y7PV85_9AGAM|nr:hypothetical protein BD410DRAFT_842225 [Rickenella mellea]
MEGVIIVKRLSRWLGTAFSPGLGGGNGVVMGEEDEDDTQATSTDLHGENSAISIFNGIAPPPTEVRGAGTYPSTLSRSSARTKHVQRRQLYLPPPPLTGLSPPPALPRPLLLRQVHRHPHEHVRIPSSSPTMETNNHPPSSSIGQLLSTTPRPSRLLSSNPIIAQSATAIARKLDWKTVVEREELACVVWRHRRRFGWRG